MTPARWTVEQTGPTVATIRIPVHRNKEWEQWALLTSDRHLDNPHSNLPMQRRHLDQAKERDAFVVDTGDLYDAMQGKNDRRSSKSDLKEALASSDYIGDLVRNAVNFFEPYADCLGVFGMGNHETAILNRLEVNLTRAMVERLNDKGSSAVLGGYRGWVRLLFSDHKNGNERSSLKLAYMHGSGGGAPVTKDVIKTSRRAVVYPDADIVVSGHVHEGWSFPIGRVRLNDAGKETRDSQLHLSIPTYKEEILDCGNGFAAEVEMSPKQIGAWWLRFFYDGGIKYDYMRAR